MVGVVVLFYVSTLAGLIALFVLIAFLRAIKNGTIALLQQEPNSGNPVIDPALESSQVPSAVPAPAIVLIFAVVAFMGICSFAYFQSSGTGIMAQSTEARLLKAAEKGDISAQHELATRYISGEGVPQDIAEAAKWLRRLVEVDGPKSVYAPNASYILGLAYYHGDGVPQDKEEGIRWFRKAAEPFSLTTFHFTQEQITDIKFTLGCAYFYGDGVTENKAEGVKWFRDLAQSMGDSRAQFMLGLSYQTGEGVQEDKAEAVEWYRRAAEKGLADAQWLLGACYFDGEGVSENKTEAIKWFRQAAEQGNAAAQFMLGVCYHDGTGVRADRAEAIKWLRSAAAQEHENAIDVLRELEKQ
jgi:TPR repeat protein